MVPISYSTDQEAENRRFSCERRVQHRRLIQEQKKFKRLSQRFCKSDTAKNEPVKTTVWKTAHHDDKHFCLRGAMDLPERWPHPEGPYGRNFILKFEDVLEQIERIQPAYIVMGSKSCQFTCGPNDRTWPHAERSAHVVAGARRHASARCPQKRAKTPAKAAAKSRFRG